MRDGHRVLVHGATGAIGTPAVQLLKYAGAYVTDLGPKAQNPGW